MPSLTFPNERAVKVKPFLSRNVASTTNYARLQKDPPAVL